MKKRIDLHIHTNNSDGILSSKEVIDEAVNNNVSVIAIADHDTTEAYNDKLYEYAKKRNVKIINAVEISTKTKNVGIHVLGYNYDLNDEIFKNRLYKLRNARHDYLHNVSEKLNELGFIVNIEELDKIDSVTKKHIALDIVNNPENLQVLNKFFSKVPSDGEFIEAIMNENCPGYVKKETITPKEAVKMIREAKGKAVLAHPVAYIHEDKLSEEEILEIVKEMKPDGIEANYIYVDKYNRIFDESEKWNQFAKDNSLFVTIGSDFHNKDNIRPQIGFSNMNYYLEEEKIKEILFNLVGKNNFNFLS